MLKSLVFNDVCGKCARQALCQQSRHTVDNSIIARNLSTSMTLQRVKRKQSKYRPPVPNFHTYGDTHRLVRGDCVRGERYGPLVELPDYTYRDGRPTPLTPKQRELREERREIVSNVMKCLQDMETVKSYNVHKEQTIQQERQQIKNKKLKAKS